MTGWRVTRPKFGAGIGLHRVRAIAERAGLDLARWGPRSVNVAGSNGKGSVALMLAAILGQAIPRVGRYLSPHYFRLNERFAIDGADADDAALGAAWARIDAAANAYEARHPGDVVGGFEFLTLVAWALFEAADVEFAVMECGIGARYDATRVGGARWAALTSLDLEHTKLLGATLEEIAYDKLDAAAPGGRVLIGADGARLRERLLAYCAMQSLSADFVESWREEDGALLVPLDAERTARVVLPLAGAHQRANAALAARLADEIMTARGIDAAARVRAVEAGLARVSAPCRLETLAQTPRIVVDAAHTPAAAAAAREGFFALAGEGPAILVCGASADKDASAILAALTPGFVLVIATRARHKGRPAGEIAALIAAARADLEIVVAADVDEASRLARERALALGASVLVAGGLFLAVEFKAAHLGMDPRALGFF
jgi:dihydrofolate synthase / folylpolyglutamate synthase